MEAPNSNGRGAETHQRGMQPQRDPAALESSVVSDGYPEAQSTSSSSSAPISTKPLSPGTLGMFKKFLPDEGWNAQPVTVQQHGGAVKNEIGVKSSFEPTAKQAHGSMPPETEIQDPEDFEIRPPVRPVFNMPMALGQPPSPS